MTEPPQFDKAGRMKYHPDFHWNHRKPVAAADLEYLCKFYDTDGSESMAYALGRTEPCIYSMVCRLKRSGEFEQYKRKWDERYERAQA